MVDGEEKSTETAKDNDDGKTSNRTRIANSRFVGEMLNRKQE